MLQVNQLNGFGIGNYAHRYWRIYFYDTPPSYPTFFFEVVCMAQIGVVVDQCTGGTPSASVIVEPGEPPSYAFDDIYNTPYRSTGAIGEWLKYDFGKQVVISEVRLLQGINGFTNFMPKKVELQWSDDDSHWFTEARFVVEWDDFGNAAGWSSLIVKDSSSIFLGYY